VTRSLLILALAAAVLPLGVPPMIAALLTPAETTAAESAS
jgi:hypothetical protein